MVLGKYDVLYDVVCEACLVVVHVGRPLMTERRDMVPCLAITAILYSC